MKNSIKIFKYQLYLLQLENYELWRYFKLLYKRGIFPPKQPLRKDLVWTMKAKTLFFCAVLLHLAVPFFLFFYLSSGLSVLSIKYYVLSILIFGLLFFLYFILYTLAVLLLWPLDWLVKNVLIIRAKSRLKNSPNLKIIGIAGSYGKTTMKEVLRSVLSAKFLVLSTPESVNTPVGIARWVLNKFDENLEVALVEMGEHYKGDVESVCEILRPDISVVTGINEAHLERMKNIETVTETIFEIISKLKPGGLAVLNSDDKKVLDHYKEYIWPDHKLEFLTNNSSSEKCKVKSAKFDTERLGWEVRIEGAGEAFIGLLGEYAIADVDAAVKVATSLGMNGEEIRKGILNVKPVEHRLQPIRSNGNILVIDDSYNGNPDGVAEAIKVLSRFTDRRKIYITPGLVEMGKSTPDVHRAIGKQLAQVAEVVILIKNSVTSYIEQGIREQVEGNGTKPEIIWFETAQEAHSSLGKILQTNDVVLFQNDWGDQYI